MRTRNPWNKVFAALSLSFSLSMTTAYAVGLNLDQAMDETTARSMLMRFGYGADGNSLSATMNRSPKQYLMRAINDTSTLPNDIATQIAALPTARPMESIWEDYGPGGRLRPDKNDTEARKAFQKTEHDYLEAASMTRLLKMANSDNPGHEALLSFWLNHFSIFAPKAYNRLLAADYTQALEQAMAADSFEALLRASFFHPAMQGYLDNAQSTAPDSKAAMAAQRQGKTLGINENLAREVMELHTLGVDAGYTQQDVQELARIITGAGVYSPNMKPQALQKAGAIRIRNGLFLFDPRRHDDAAKTFLGQDFPAGQGLNEIERALHMLAISPKTAHHIAFKLAQRFLADNPPEPIVKAMAQAYERSGGRISATLLPLLSSTEFAASLNPPGKFKEPLDYIVSVARTACSGQSIGNAIPLLNAARDMGEAPYMHTTPDGYGAREADWLSPPAMAKRARFAMGVATRRIPLAQAAPIDTTTVAENTTPPAAASVVPNKPQGVACTPDLTTVTHLIGALSAATQSAEAGLPPPQRIALYLASPEFMRR